MSLHQAFRSDQNAFNALRLLLALLVIVSHAPLAGWGENPYQWGDIELGGWAVCGFFAISGWLLAGSRLRLGVGGFLWRRSLRILPGFWVALVVTAFVLVPLSTLHSGAWHPTESASYVLRNLTLTILQPDVPDTLAGAPFSGNWNISLWTLRIEFACYVLLAVLYLWTRARAQRWVTLVTAMAVIAAHLAVATLTLPFPTHTLDLVLRLACFFFAGACLSRYASVVPCHWAIAALCAVILAGLGATGLGADLGGPPLAYLVVYAGVRLPVESWGATHDISYGVYLYAFPVQLLLANAGWLGGGVPGFVALTLALVVPLAWLSWLLVERPALRLRSLRLPRRVAKHPVLVERL